MSYQTFFKHSGTLAYETKSFDGFVSAHASLSGVMGVIDVHGDDQANADFIVFEVESGVGSFDIYDTSRLPQGVEYVGHYSSVPEPDDYAA